MTSVLSVTSLSKRYLVRSEQSLLLGLARRQRARAVWALRGVTLELQAGEVLAAIGRNGAGKSTLLKLCAGVTTATEGSVRRPQRVAPLIEVGAGFHPDLTGRENVEVNGRLLGLSRTQLAAKFDEMVAFAELDAVIDQPVKQYSTGMLMRLGFAVAAHTEPQLLVVDEVLAVGDLPFQNRCLERIKQIRSEGAGVLFVSHDLGAVLSLADRALLLHHGEPHEFGEPRMVVGAYHELLNREGVDQGSNEDEDIGVDGALELVEAKLVGPDGEVPALWHTGETAVLSLRLRATRDQGRATCGLQLYESGRGLLSSWASEPAAVPSMREGEEIDIALTLSIPVNGGSFVLDAALVAEDWSAIRWVQRPVVEFSVAEHPWRKGTVGMPVDLQATVR